MEKNVLPVLLGHVVYQKVNFLLPALLVLLELFKIKLEKKVCNPCSKDAISSPGAIQCLPGSYKDYITKNCEKTNDISPKGTLCLSPSHKNTWISDGKKWLETSLNGKPAKHCGYIPCMYPGQTCYLGTNELYYCQFKQAIKPACKPGGRFSCWGKSPAKT